MKRTVPFTKTITFKTMIAEITDIEVSHNLELTDNYELEGDILVDGKYKMHEASQIEEEFHYKLPFLISIDQKYNLSNLDISIGDFYFEIINEEDLKINVEIDIDGLEEKTQKPEIISTKVSLEQEELLDLEEELVRNDFDMEIPVEIEDSYEKFEFKDNPLNQLAKEIEEDLNYEMEIDSPKVEVNNYMPEKNTTSSTNMSSIFSALASSEETFSTYYVYIVRENDTIESIVDKYNTTKDELQNYNDLTEVKIGSKLIIPCSSHYE